MSLVEILGSLIIVVSVLVGIATVVTVGFERLKREVRELPKRIKRASPYIGIVIVTLLINKFTRDIGPEISRVIGWNITGQIHNLEGSFVSSLQIENEMLIAYFSFSYIYLYVFILVIPFVVYFTLEDQSPLRRLSVAFVVNYTVGVMLYILLISYGPRNILEAQEFMYSFYPDTQLLTSKVNSNTNVFPSLHSSLSVTVVGLAWQTRERFPRLLYITTPVAISVILATMYLGIHWFTDVVAGALLAVISLYVATEWESRREKAARFVPERVKSLWTN